MKNKIVICLSKYPEVGKVKTRLGKEIGMNKACYIQKLFLKEIVKNNYSNINDYNFIFCINKKEKIKIFSKEFSINEKDIFSLNIDDLGELMSDIFSYAFKLGYKEVILIGSDIPDLNNKDFDLGFKYLKTRDIILGKTEDGGYYLVGMKRLYSHIFKDIVYSTNTVLKETIKKCEDSNLSYSILEEKIDIDDLQSLKKAIKIKKEKGFYKNLI